MTQIPESADMELNELSAEIGMIYEAENQITGLLPSMVFAVQLEDLKNTLAAQLVESEMQLERLEGLFSRIGTFPSEAYDPQIEAMVSTTERLLRDGELSMTRDQALLAAMVSFRQFTVDRCHAAHDLATRLDQQDIAAQLREMSQIESEARRTLTSYLRS